jgi:pSer/pThr/pTyr-binding forkhead associated (FHA) protein
LQEGLGNPGSTHRLATAPNQDSAYFGQQMTLALRVEDSDNLIRVRPGKSELVIGRRSPESVMIPDVDLARYQAEKKGVSRLHAALQRHDTTLVLTDMGSLNHTYINGQRVHAHEVRVVHDGDQLQFGQLRVNVYFEQG